MCLYKNVFRGLVLGLVVFSCSPVFAEGRGTVVEQGAFVSEDATDSSQVVTNLDLGQTVEVLNVEGDFYKVALEGIEKAFVLDKFLSVYEAAGVVIGDDVVVRQQPTTDSNQVDILQYGSKVTVNGIVGDFYRINYNGDNFYVHSDFVIGDMIYSVQKIEAETVEDSEKSTFGTVISETGLNLRVEASSDADVLKVISKNSVVDILESNGEWTKVLARGQEGYVNTDFLVIQTGVRPEEPEEVVEEEVASAPSAANNSLADQIIAYGKQFLGTPYSWGGTNLKRGVDCSGFVYAVMKDHGVYLSRSSRDQIHNGTRVSKDNLQKGDLVFFDTTGPNNGAISHVGIYMGDGQFIHSSSGKQWGITISSLSEAYYIRTYVGACRVL